jgi:hypothetical protein
MTNNLNSDFYDDRDITPLLEPGILKIVCINKNRALILECDNMLSEISNFQENVLSGTIDNP